MADRLGIEVSRNYRPEFKDVSGWIEIGGDGAPLIWINPTEIKVRQRFTLAHELAHLFKDILPSFDQYRRAGSKKRIEDSDHTLRRDGRAVPMEFAANRFAGQLLMPKPQIGKYGKKTIADHKNRHDADKMPKRQFIADMAELFGVSQAAMEVRLKILGVIR